MRRYYTTHPSVNEVSDRCPKPPRRLDTRALHTYTCRFAFAPGRISVDQYMASAAIQEKLSFTDGDFNAKP